MRSFARDNRSLIRFIAYSPEPVVGCFRFRDILQMFALPSDAPKPEWSYADHPFIIEYAFDNVDVEILREIRTTGLHPSSDVPPDQSLEFDYHLSKQQEILSLLSVVTRHLITRENAEHRWVLDTDGKTTSGKFAQTGYYWDGFGKLADWFSTPQLSTISLSDANTYYNGFGCTGNPLDLSDATTKLLEAYFQLDDEEKESFLSACVLFSRALRAWAISHSLTYIGIVSSLEALIEFDQRNSKTQHCANCGQPMYKVRRKFLDFVATYCSPEPESRKFADHLYSRRSGIGHQGKVLAGDVAGRVVPPKDEGQDQWELMQLNRVARTSLVNWLLRRYKGPDASSDSERA